MKTIEELRTARKAVMSDIWAIRAQEREAIQNLRKSFKDKLAPFEDKYNKLSKELNTQKDGYIWVCITRIWGHSEMTVYNNCYSCNDFANQYCGDNGYAHVITNCRNISDDTFYNDGVEITYINNIKDIPETEIFELYSEEENNLKEEYQKLLK